MTEYLITKIKCNKGIKINELYDFFNHAVSCDKFYFEIGDIENNNSAFQKAVLSEFKENYYSKRIPYSVSSDREIFMVSNLNSNWDWENEKNSAPLNKQRTDVLMKTFSQAKCYDCSTFMLVYDEIPWNNESVLSGTYGFEKAKSRYDNGCNYLSNSIIISKESYENICTIYISRLADNCIDDFINDIEQRFGTVLETKSYFAPDDESERREWAKVYIKEKSAFDHMFSSLPAFYSTLPFDLGEYDVNREQSPETINVKRIAKSIFAPQGWTLLKNPKGEKGVHFERSFSNKVLRISIMPLHKGHHLQTLILYKSTMFYFTKQTNYSYILSDSDEVEKYCHNVLYISDYIVEQLNSES